MRRIFRQEAVGADDLAYIANHYIYLDHDQTYTGSGGLSYAFQSGPLAGTSVGGSMLYGSGLRTDQTLADSSTVPNGGKLSPYAQVNLTANHHFSGPGARSGIDIRFDVINVADHKYEICDGGGVGVGAPQYGPRRGLFFGVSKAFG